MARWRNPELEAIFDGPLDDTGITAETIQRLVDNHTSEFELLDFKTGLYQSTSASPWSDKQEICKDIALFANHRGGVLVLGVEDVAGVAVALDPVTTLNPEAEENRLRALIREYQAPRAECHFYWIPTVAPEKWFVAIVVPPSPRAPHAVIQFNDKRRSHTFPVRDGPGTRYLLEPEIADRYRSRDTARRDQARRLESVVSDAWAALEWTEELWLYAACVPESPVPGRVDRQAVDDAEQWFLHERFPSPLNVPLGADGRGIPRPGSVTFTAAKRHGLEDATDVRDGYVELHVDGSAFVATRAWFDPDDESRGRMLGEMSLVDNCIQLVDIALRWPAHQAGAWGAATIRCGFMDSASEEPGTLTAPIQIASHAHGAWMRLSESRLVSHRSPHSDAVADLAIVETHQQRLVVTYEAMSGLFHSFGLIEPTQLTFDGSIVPAEFPGKQRDVAAWADAWGVDKAGVRVW